MQVTVSTVQFSVEEKRQSLAEKAHQNEPSVQNNSNCQLLDSLIDYVVPKMDGCIFFFKTETGVIVDYV